MDKETVLFFRDFLAKYHASCMPFKKSIKGYFKVKIDFKMIDI